MNEISSSTRSNAAVALIEQFNRMSRSGRVMFFFAYATMISELGYTTWVSDLKAPKYLHEFLNRGNRFVSNLQR